MELKYCIRTEPHGVGLHIWLASAPFPLCLSWKCLIGSVMQYQNSEGVLFPWALVSTKNFIDFAFSLEKTHSPTYTHTCTLRNVNVSFYELGFMVFCCLDLVSACTVSSVPYFAGTNFSFPTAPYYFILCHTFSLSVSLSIVSVILSVSLRSPDRIDLLQRFYYVIKTALGRLSHQKACSEI